MAHSRKQGAGIAGRDEHPKHAASTVLGDDSRVSDHEGFTVRRAAAQHFTTKTSTTELECVGSVRTAAPNNTPPSFGAVWPTYCFLKGQPVLTASHENGSLINVYGKVQKFQDHYFPGDIEILYVGKKRLVATLEESNLVAADDDAFTPAADAKEPPPPVVIVVPKGGGIQLPSLIHRVEPIFPQSYLAMRKEGTVVLSALIGKDGSVKDAKIVSSPDAALSAAALDAVRQWRYEPATMNGQPADLNTTITLNFAVKH
jgi:TonB family protein